MRCIRTLSMTPRAGCGLAAFERVHTLVRIHRTHFPNSTAWIVSAGGPSTSGMSIVSDSESWGEDQRRRAAMFADPAMLAYLHSYDDGLASPFVDGGRVSLAAPLEGLDLGPLPPPGESPRAAVLLLDRLTPETVALIPQGVALMTERFGVTVRAATRTIDGAVPAMIQTIMTAPSAGELGDAIDATSDDDDVQAFLVKMLPYRIGMATLDEIVVPA